MKRGGMSLRMTVLLALACNGAWAAESCEGLGPASSSYANCMGGRQLQQSRRDMERRLAQLRAKLGAEPARRLSAVVRNSDRYVEIAAVVVDSASATGSAYASILTNTRIRLGQRMLARMEQAQAAPATPVSEQAYADADGQLNREYAGATRRCRDSEASIRSEYSKDPDRVRSLTTGRSCTQLRDMQRAWIQYRDAMSAFYNGLGPAGQADRGRRVALELTQEQTELLKNYEYE